MRRCARANERSAQTRRSPKIAVPRRTIVAPLGDSPLKVAAHAHRERQVRLFDAQARCGLVPADAASAWLYLYPQVVVARSNVSGYGVNSLNSQFFVSGISKN